MAYRSNGYQEEELEVGPLDDGEKPIFLMEHLATFTVTKETGILQPTDGMRRLLELEKSNGIWSQKMQLCLDRPWVLIMDYETGGVMERFPLSSIQEPTAFTSHDPMEMYNNILVFIVLNSNHSHPPEMHIFQCQSVSALDLVEDLKQLRMGKSLSRTNKRNSMPTGGQLHGYHTPNAATISNDNDSSSTTSEKYEKDVTILNHCFDDIEKFIARLQHAAAAARELERRRRTRKTKKKDMGDGMLSMRTKPPPEKEFIDIFQKFKLSFNLLAKLKAHIHDPNAPELVHFLFTPLALIVEASHDTYFDLHLPHKVVSPLLTREAVNLLMNCVTSKETELWHSLGNAWLIPRDQWKSHVAPYHPIFMDGWSPDFPIIDENSTSSHNLTPTSDTSKMYPSENENHLSHHHVHHPRHPYNETGADYDYESSSGIMMKSSDRSGGGSGGIVSASSGTGGLMHEVGGNALILDSTKSDISIDSIERPNGDQGHATPSPPHMHGHHPSGGHATAHTQATPNMRTSKGQEAFLEELQARGAHIVQVTYPRTANNDKELTVVRGELLEVLDDSRKWWKARNANGQIAHVPHTIVSAYSGSTGGSNDIFNNPLYMTYGYNGSGGGGGGGGGHGHHNTRGDAEGSGPGRIHGVPNQSHSAHVQSHPREYGVDRYHDSISPEPDNSNQTTSSSSVDWVRKERLGKKGEFRYF